MAHRLLLADDSITIQKVVGIILANEDFDLTVVNDGDAALQRARELRPDIILVDTQMPGRNGYEVCRELRQDPGLAAIPVVLLTGAFEPFDEGQAKECGANGHITKPFESQQLVDVLQRLLSASRQTTEVQEPLAEIPAEAPVETASEQPPFDLEIEAPYAGVAAAVTAEPPVASVEIVEATPADDLWGAYEMVEVSEAEYTEAGPVEELTPPTAVPSPEPDEFAAEWHGPVSDPEWSEAAASTWGVGPAAVPAEEELAVVPPEQGPAATEPFAFQPESEAAPAPAMAAESAASASLTDQQLEALVARISRDIIERIAWEVVPDLAEAIIKEEIRKIKEG